MHSNRNLWNLKRFTEHLYPALPKDSISSVYSRTLDKLDTDAKLAEFCFTFVSCSNAQIVQYYTCGTTQKVNWTLMLSLT